MLDAVRAMRAVVVEEHRAHVAGIASVTVWAWRYRRCRRGRFAFTLLAAHGGILLSLRSPCRGAFFFPLLFGGTKLRKKRGGGGRFPARANPPPGPRHNPPVGLVTAVSGSRRVKGGSG